MSEFKLQALCQKFNILLMTVLLMCAHDSQSQSWQLEGLQMKTTQQGVELQLNSLTLPESQPIKQIHYRCDDELLIYPSHHCQQADLSFNYDNQTYQAVLDSEFDFSNNAWQVSLSSLNGQLKLKANSNAPMIEIQLNELLPQDFIGEYASQAAAWSNLPKVSLSGSLVFMTEEAELLTPSKLNFSGFNYEHSDDIIFADLQGELSFTLDVSHEKLQYQLNIDAGEMLLNELYVNFSEYPIQATGEVQWHPNGWHSFNTTLKNRQSLQLLTAFEFNDALNLKSIALNAQVIDAHHFNQNILSGVLGIYGFGDSEMSGQFRVNVASAEAGFDQWQIDFDDYYFLNERRKIAAESLSGVLHWKQNNKAEDSQLNWQRLELAGLPINESMARFNLTADEFYLVGQHHFPVFDGAIDITEWQMSDLFSESLDMRLNAAVVPMSLRLITEKLGWPIMAGTISGNIPGMVKKDQVIEFLGALNLEVFNGSMLVDNLSMERLFGVAPVIAADIEFEGFDLSLLTETFGFGLITGKLYGFVDGLRITNWKTDRLNAEVYTVKTKGIKQTISQRAIDNISSLGGIQGAISKTFLRFFDDFRYSKIKLSCKLHNSVCQIGGIKNSDNQFTIVEGGGIPNINIVGFVRSIDWDEFISRLLNANYDG